MYNPDSLLQALENTEERNVSYRWVAISVDKRDGVPALLAKVYLHESVEPDKNANNN